MADAPDITLEQYAELLAELGRAGPSWLDVLARRSLSEEEWERIDEHYQAELERASELCASDEVPELVSRFSRSFAGAPSSTAPGLTLEQYAELVRLAQSGAQLHKVLAERGLSIHDYLDAHTFYLKRMLETPELAQRFEKLIHGELTAADEQSS